MVRIIQVLPPHPSEYDRKCQRIDYELLQQQDFPADVTLIYGKPPASELPEAVEERYWRVENRQSCLSGQAGLPVLHIGSFRRKSIIPLVEQSMARIHRTREDIDWLLLDEPPSDFAAFDVWVDPALDADDRDGFVAEAQVAGKIVVASRTPINIKRLEKGRTGFLVPPADPNELTHAILAALFKPEVSDSKIEAAKQTISKYHPRQRLRALMLILNA